MNGTTDRKNDDQLAHLLRCGGEAGFRAAWAWETLAFFLAIPLGSAAIFSSITETAWEAMALAGLFVCLLDCSLALIGIRFVVLVQKPGSTNGEKK